MEAVTTDEPNYKIKADTITSRQITDISAVLSVAVAIVATGLTFGADVPKIILY